jgi:hypothetical protein
VRALVCIFVVAGVAGAEDDAPEKAQARVLLSQGNALFERGDLKGALVDFRAAYSLYPSPKLLVNCAAAERELGDLAAAANDLRHYLDDATDDDPFLTDRARGDLKALERKLGRVGVSSWPPRTAVDIDGKPGRDPTYVKPGAHHVRLRAPSGESLERDVELGVGELVELPMVARVLQPPPGSSSHRVVDKPKSKAWVAAVVVTAVIVAGAAVGLGVAFGTQSAPEPLKGALGTFKFSEFH